MEIRKTIAWIGAATLTTALFTVLMWPEESVPKPAAEPDLFAFIKPSADAQASEGAKPASATRRRKPSGDTDEERSALYAAQQAALREVPDATMKVASVQEAAQKMRSQGASEDDIYRMRAAELSTEAAAQLAGMDREENAWKTRISAYLAERNRLLNGNEAGAPHQDALQQLRDARFTAEEQKLLAAYEPLNVPQLKMD